MKHLSAETIDAIWEELESPYPMTVVSDCHPPQSVWHEYRWFYGATPVQWDTCETTGDAYWEWVATFYLLVLCAEGEEIV